MSKWTRQQDRWGLKPVRPGRVRGLIMNLRRHAEVCEFGNLHVIEFDLFVDDGQKPLPVRMRGTSFSNDIFAGSLVELRDPDPGTRPILARRLDFPPLYNTEMISYYPGENDPPPARARLWATLAVVGPIALAGLLLGLFYTFWGG